MLRVCQCLRVYTCVIVKYPLVYLCIYVYSCERACVCVCVYMYMFLRRHMYTFTHVRVNAWIRMAIDTGRRIRIHIHNTTGYDGFHWCDGFDFIGWKQRRSLVYCSRRGSDRSYQIHAADAREIGKNAKTKSETMPKQEKKIDEEQ